MCDTCGCGKPDEFKIHDRNHSHDHEHSHDHDHEHNHTHDHDHQHPHDHDHTHEHPQTRTIDLNLDIMSENNRLAELNSRFFEGRKVLCLNLVSYPGSGKTTILEKSIEALKTG